MACLLNRCWPLIVITILFLCALGLQWHGHQDIAVADSVGYITSGTNLVRSGDFQNAFGESETWFPPVYPVLIGLGSLGGLIDPLLVARLIAAASSVLCLALVWFCIRIALPGERLAPVLACLVLICNWCFQVQGNAALSEATATALCLGAFAVWLVSTWTAPHGRFAGLGILIGLAYLTRPEGILLLPLFAAIDAFRFGFRTVFSRYAVAAATMALTILPYAYYLYLQTGKWTLSGKSEVNLAAGRAQYYGTMREYIDPSTLEMGYHPTEVTLASEAARYAANVTEIGRAYVSIYRWPLGLFLLAAGLLGVWSLARSAKWRFLAGLLAQFAYLAVAAIYGVSPRYLHATLPAASICMGVGLALACRAVLDSRLATVNRVAFAGLLLCATLALAEGGSRQPRWTLSEPTDVTMLRDAGLRMSAAGWAPGTLYEDGATIGYYAGQRRGRITGNDLEIMTRYIHNRHAQDPEPVYFAVTSFGIYHRSVAELLHHEAAGYVPILTMQDPRGRVVIYRVTPKTSWLGI